jgi:hypothetical protein
VRLDDVDGRDEPWDEPGHDAVAADVASPVSSKGTHRRPVRTRNVGRRLPPYGNDGYMFPKTGISARFKILSIRTPFPP